MPSPVVGEDAKVRGKIRDYEVPGRMVGPRAVDEHHWVSVITVKLVV
jgi:hypothetical protein